MLQIKLLGAPEIWRDGEKMALPGSASAVTLFAYLCLHRDYPIHRAVLAGTFWPEAPESRARRSLSQALWQIRKVLPGVVEADANQVALLADGDMRLTVDVDEFQSLLKNDREDSTRTGSAVEIYRGDLLEGYYDDWILLAREQLREQFIQALEQIIQADKRDRQYGRALGYARRLSREDPLHENAHQEIMRLHLVLGAPEAALKQYENCVMLLEGELGVPPSPETQALAEAIRSRLAGAGTGRTAAAAPGQGAGQAAGDPAMIPYLPQKKTDSSPLLTERPVNIPLVGRRRERAELVACLEGAAENLGGATLVEGDAGVGKTRLVQEVVRDAEWRGVQAVWGYCLESHAGQSYQPIIDALEAGLSPLRISQISQMIEPLWLQALADFMPQLGAIQQTKTRLTTLEAPQAQQRMITALTQLLTAWGQITPVLLVIEDIHWADLDLLELLVTLVERLRNQRVLILATYRSEDARATPALWEKIRQMDQTGLRCRMILGGLDAVGAGKLVRQSLRLAKPAPLFEERLYHETGGNPLFLVEILRALVDEGVLTQDAEDGNWHTPWDESTSNYGELPMPSAVERVIAQRLAHIVGDRLTVLQLAAIFGQRFDFRLLQAANAIPLDELLGILEDLVHLRFINETQADYVFSHAKVQEVVYASLDEEARITLHAKAGEALEQHDPEQAARLAYHFHQAQDWARSYRYSQRAGEQAVSLYANREAVAHFQRAVEARAHLPSSGDRRLKEIDLQLTLEMVLNRLGERDAQQDTLTRLDQLLEEMESDDQAAHAEQAALARRVAMLWAKYHHSVSAYPQALARIEQVYAAAIQEEDRPMALDALLAWGLMLKDFRDFDQATVRYQEAYALAEALDDPAAQANSLQRLAWMHFERGEYDVARITAQKSLDRFPEGGDPLIQAGARTVLSNVYHYLADFPQALVHLQKTLVVYRQVGDRRMETGALYNLSLVHHDSGNQIAARDALLQVCQISQEIGEKNYHAYGRVFLGLVYEALRDWPAARAAYAAGLEMRHAIHQPALANDPLAGLARVATAEGRHEEAAGYGRQVLDWIKEHGHAGIGDPLLAYQGAYRALLAAGGADEARGRAALECAYVLLMTFADNIEDPERRRAYLHDIEPGRGIWTDYQRYFEGKRAEVRAVQIAQAGAPTGRPLRDDEMVLVQWTVAEPEDDEIRGKGARRRIQVLRLLSQAEAQGGAPTVDDLAAALGVSAPTIKRDLAALRKAGHAVKTRGRRRGEVVHDEN